MNPEWIDFLKSDETINTNNTDETLTAVSNLAIIEVSGNDAGQFLQGQLTCDIKDITDSNSFFVAFCNAKGRTISTLLILKNNEIFLLILPVTLIDKVINKLKMYILRADVQLKSALDNYCLIGVKSSKCSMMDHLNTDFEVSNSSEIIIKLPTDSNRYLIVSRINRATQLWTQLTQTQELLVTKQDQWDYQDISAGIPWLDEKSSEEYIPQMLNIDKLGGISFQKGCYTGQEIIARTHFLGKAKRELYLVECDKKAAVDRDTHIISNHQKQSIGKIISLQTNHQHCRLLSVIPTTASELNNLTLDNSNQDKINIIDFQ